MGFVAFALFLLWETILAMRLSREEQKCTSPLLFSSALGAVFSINRFSHSTRRTRFPRLKNFQTIIKDPAFAIESLPAEKEQNWRGNWLKHTKHTNILHFAIANVCALMQNWCTHEDALKLPQKVNILNPFITLAVILTASSHARFTSNQILARQGTSPLYQ